MDTNLNDGETQVICGVCLPMYALNMAAALTAGMEKEEALTYADALDTIYANDPRAPKSDRLRPRGKGKAQAAGQAAQGSAADLPAAVPAEPGATASVPVDGAERPAGAFVDMPEPCGACGSTTALGDAEKLTCAGCGEVIATADQAG